MTIYQKHFREYLRAGFSVIPERQTSHAPIVPGWNRFCDNAPSIDEAKSFCSESAETNIGLCLGAASGVIGLDLDTTDPEVLELILPYLPQSPVEKVGSKGWTRFFRFTGEHPQVLKFNGDVVIEILGTGKKTTIPPSIHHKIGQPYKWTGKSLLEVDKEDLPILPPFLFPHLEDLLRIKSPESTFDIRGKVHSMAEGRNVSLTKLASKLIAEKIELASAVETLVNFDRENHNSPLFEDISENRQPEPYTNALRFYSNRLTGINTNHYSRAEPPEVPHIAIAVPTTKETMDKSPERIEIENPKPEGLLAEIMDYILSNSFVAQPNFAFSAALSILATVIGRKYVFQGVAPNLYLLNIASSGCVDANTEYMSKSGWKPISSYNGVDDVLQYDTKTGKSSFVQPLEYVNLPETELIHFESSRGAINQTLSAEHRMIFRDHKGKLTVDRAGNIFRKRKFPGNIITTFDYSGDGIPFTDEQLRVQVAFLADGALAPTGMPRITVKKERKKERLEKLLKEASIEFTRSDYDDGYSRFHFMPPILEKTFTPMYYNANRAQFKVITDEISYWDGYKSQYFSTKKEDADFIQFAYAAQNIRATISEDVREGRKTCYMVYASSYHPDVSLGTKPTITKVQAKYGRKYCFKVPSDTLVLRKNGRIFITKNSGKDAPQQCIKRILQQSGAGKLLGSGDYVSDAALMDQLQESPSRVDLIDEASGLLKNVTAGRSEYNGKMADILCELYTTSTDRYMGRMTAEGRKGECYRPNVNILASTTPKGLEQSLSQSAVDKGLIGRFLVYFGSHNQPAKRVKKRTDIPVSVLEDISYLHKLQVEEEHKYGRVNQNYKELNATEEANQKLETHFKELDELRRNTDATNPVLPVISRLYQMMLKLCMIHAVSRCRRDEPIINEKDVDFAYKSMLYYYNNMKFLIENHIFENWVEARSRKVLRIIQQHPDGVKMTDLTKMTKFLKTKERREVVDALIEEEQVLVITVKENDKSVLYFKAVV